MTSHDAYCLLMGKGESSTFQEALSNADASLWIIAMQEEMKALHRNQTWEPIALPNGQKANRKKSIYKIKWDGNDRVERYHERLVVTWYAQKEGIDFNEMFSPIVRLTTIRVFLAMYAAFDLHHEELDVKLLSSWSTCIRDIHSLTKRLWRKKKRKLGLQVNQISVRFKTCTKMVVKEIWFLHN